MCEKFEIDDKTRFLVLYFDAHMNSHQISKILNRSLQIIRYWESKTKLGEDIRIMKKGPRKKYITEETENKIITLLKENPEGTSTTKLSARMGISQKSVAKILAKKGYKYMGIDKSITYSEDERMNRVDFCKKMIGNEGELVYRSFFSDEMGIELGSSYKSRTWQIPTQKIKKKYVPENVKLACWGAISAQGATTLSIYENGMNGDLYREVIERHKEEMEKLYPGGEFCFVQDNHPVHRMNEDWIIHEHKLNLIKLPSKSPDLNIIENLWSALKERVKGDAPTNKNELKASLTHNWGILTKTDRLQRFFEGLHRRYMICVAKEGQKLRG